ncbi:MAG: Gfo/Idh/MocA family oxidoreductase [Defluviitaleaceae bacterium]|nr:Gfo/Idh/MocA family oxidoreductase [Defluviitaleaceae bacterium]
MIKVGILGTGFGTTHLELYSKVDGFNIVSVFGRNEEKLKEIAEKYNVSATTNINEVINNPEVDLVDICLPTELHSKWAIEGLKRGKHIFCETPISCSVEEATAVQQAAEQYGKKVFVNLFIKFSTPHQYAIELAKKAELGGLLGIRSYNKTSSRWGNLGLQKNVESFHNHMMDFVVEIAGLPSSVTASGADYDDKSIVTSALNYDGLYAVLESNSCLPNCCPFEIGFELLFENGIARFDAIYHEEFEKEEFLVTANGKPREIVELDSKDEYEEVLKHILKCLKCDVKSDLIDIDNAIKGVKLKEMILKSLL